MTFYKAFLRHHLFLKKKNRGVKKSLFHHAENTPACLKKFHPTKTHDGAVSSEEQKATKSNKKQPLFFAKNALVLCPYLPRLRINIAENARKDTYRYKCSVYSFSVLVSSRCRSYARIERSKSLFFWCIFCVKNSRV